jgi:uncharacterized protein (TIGR02678 family)
MKRSEATPDPHTFEERRRAFRALLLRPLLTASGDSAEDLALVRRHAEHLREWVARNVDWTLTVEPHLARLRKTPGRLGDDTRPAVDQTTGHAFTRRRYILLCFALAALERSERQTTLGSVADEVERRYHADLGDREGELAWDRATQDGRRDLVFAVRLLLDLGVLTRVHGDEGQFVQSSGDVLYNVDRPALSLVLASRRPPSMYEGPKDTLERERHLVEEPLPESDDARNRGLRIALTRRLLEEPVVYFDTLTADERAYLTSQRAHLCRQVEEATGLIAEVRAEGIALVDEGGHLTDFGLPEEGTEGHLCLLVAELLAGRARKHPGVVVPRAAIVSEVASLVRRYAEHWRRDTREQGAEEWLAEETMQRLEALGLARLTPEGVVPLPAIGRYAIGKARASSSGTMNLPGLEPSSAR